MGSRADGLLQAITQQRPVGQIGELVVGEVVHRLLLDGSGLSAQLVGLIDHQRASLVGDHGADVLAPERERKGHEIEKPKGLVFPLGLDERIERDPAGVVDGDQPRGDHDGDHSNDDAVVGVLARFALQQCRVARKAVVGAYRHANSYVCGGRPTGTQPLTFPDVRPTGRYSR